MHLLPFLLTIAICASSALATAPQDSLLRQNVLLAQMSDSLDLGIAELRQAWEQKERLQRDSVTAAVEYNLVRPWKNWADLNGPRPGIDAQHFYKFARLYSTLDQFDVDGAYDQQLNCYRWAARYEGEAFRATKLLHGEYHRAGFAPGMIQSGEFLMNLDEARALQSDVAKSISMAYYFIGDKAQATRWIKRHLESKPHDESARELKKKIKKLKKR